MAPTQDLIIRKQLEDLPAPLMTHVPSASPELNALIFQMLEKDPEKRIPEMRIVLEHLTRWAQEDPSVRLNQVASLPSEGRDAGSR
jgi:hypothetical protein